MHVSKTDVQKKTAIAPQTVDGYPVALPQRASAAGRFGRFLWAAAFFSGLVILIHVLANLAATLAPDFNTRFLQVDRQHVANILANAERIDVLALGNSHAGSLHLGSLDARHGYRFPRADGDLFETRVLVHYLAPRLPQMQTVLIPISYFSFLTENTTSAEVAVRREHLYAALPTWQFPLSDLKPFLLGKSHRYLPVGRLIREDNWEGVFYALLGRPPELKGFVEVAEGDCSSLSPAELAASAENRVTKYMRLNREMTAQRPDLPEKTYAALADTIRELQQRGVRVVLFTPPYWQGYNERYQAADPEPIHLMYASLARLQDELGVEYYDFSADAAISANPALFKDSDHLNSCGAREFSERLAQAMRAQQAVQP